MFKKIFLLLFLTPIILHAQDCIDESSINPDCICSLIYDPVCGCDGVLYSNSCLATECEGVTSYVSAYDEQGNLIDCSTLVEGSVCDSITVEYAGLVYSPEDDELYIQINLSTNLPDEVNFPYAGFIMVNEDGETLAYESDNAANVYGFGGVYSDTRYLLVNDLLDFPFEGNIQLISGYFASTEEVIECTFPINISFESDVNLVGQYVLESEFDYIEINENEFIIYDFEEDFSCYELIEFTYLANDSIILLTETDEEIQLILNYQFNDVLSIEMDGDFYELETVNFNPDTMLECGSCNIDSVFVEAGECDSLGYFMLELDFTVENPQSSGFSVKGNGTTYGAFDYGQTSYMIGPLLGDGTTEYEFVVIDNDNEDCSDFYELGTVDCPQTTHIMPVDFTSKKLLYIKNLLGETIVNPKTNIPYIYFYDDGSYEKKVTFVTN